MGGVKGGGLVLVGKDV